MSTQFAETGTLAREAHEFTPHQQVALLARMLAREGYDDHHVGHISVRQPDDSLLVNPWELSWDEVRASDVMQIDLSGKVLAGRWDITPAIHLHLALHRRHPELRVGIHHHPRFGTVWAAAGRIPPAYDQVSSMVRDARIGLLDEFVGSVDDVTAAERNIDAIADADCVFLSNHGVMVVAPNVDRAHLLAVALERRSRLAWHVETLGNGRPMPGPQAIALAEGIEKRGTFPHLFSSMARREIRIDPSVLT